MADITGAGTQHYQCSEFCERAPLHDGPCEPAPDRSITAAGHILAAMREALEADNFPRFLTQLRHLKRVHTDLWKWALLIEERTENAWREAEARGEGQWWEEDRR